MRPVTVVLVLSCALVASAASIYDSNSVLETPRLNSGDELLSAVMGDCLGADAAMYCLKGKVLTYLDSKLGLQSEQGRAFAPENVDKAIFERVGRVLATNQFSVQLPETVFGSTKVTMNGRRGFDMEIPEETQHGKALRGHLIATNTNFPLYFVASPWTVEEEAPVARPSSDETENEDVDAHLCRSDRSEGDQGPHPVQAGHYPSPWFPGRAAVEEDRSRSAHVHDANDARPFSS